MGIIASVVVTPAVDDAEQGLVTAAFIPVANVPYDNVVAEVTPSVIQSSQTYVSPVVDTDYVSPVAGLSYAIPITEVDYLEIGTIVFIDDSGLFQIRFDISVVVDAAALTVGKQLSNEVVITQDLLGLTVAKVTADTTSATDALAFSFGTGALDSFDTADLFSKVFLKSLSDATSTADTIVGRAFEKRLYDAATMEDLVGVPDGATYQFCKYLSDFPSIAEQLSKDISTLLNDTQGVVDSPTLAVAKTLLDSFSTADESTFAFGKGLADDTSGVDDLSYNFSTSQADATTIIEQAQFNFATALADSNVVQDQSLRQFNAAKSDNFALVETTVFAVGTSLDDGQQVLDAAAFALSTDAEDALIVADANSIYTYKTDSDAVTTADSGILSAQNYCDSSYFLEDYVGDYRQF